MAGGWLDWGNQPTPFKTYEGLPAVPLPEVTEWPQSLLSEVLGAEPECSPLDLTRLSSLLRLAHAVTAKARYAGGEFYYRSVASAGALYPFELYVAAMAVDGLPQGLYHHNVMTQELTLLRSGNPAPEVARCLGRKGPLPLQAAFFLTSIFFRSSWKYRDRAYRYHLLDTGHLAENLSLAARALKLPCAFRFDFDDKLVNDLLCVDSDREVCLAAALVENKRPLHDEAAGPLGDPLKDLAEQSRVSTREVKHPLIHAIHGLCEHVAAPPVDQPAMEDRIGLSSGLSIPFSMPQPSPEVMGYAEAVFRRRSMRNLVSARLPAPQWATLLDMLCFPSKDDTHASEVAADAVAVGLLTGNVEGLTEGFHLLDRGNRAVRLVSEGSFTDTMADVCLGQRWLAHAAMQFLFLTNLRTLEQAYGPRGYRRAMLEAGRLGQRLYLAATSMKLGCCGIGALYDGEAAQLLGLDDESVLLYLVAVGPVRKWSQTSQ